MRRRENKARRPAGPPARRETGPHALDIAIAWKPRADWRAVPLLRRVAKHALAAQGFRSGQLSVAVVGTRAMSTLHQRFLQLPGPTDVLSFDLGTDRDAGHLEAEIVLCADVARRNARARGGTLKAAREELALYLVHGILHLAGYDDHAPADFDRMHRREDTLLRELRLGPIFQEGTPAR